MKYILSLLLIFLSIAISAQTRAEKRQDSIYSLRALANDTDIPIDKRFEYARAAMTLSKETRKDSTILASNRVLSYLFLTNRDVDSLYGINSENLKLASRLKDTLRMAYATHNIAYHFHANNVLDSSYSYYYNARKLFKSIGEKRIEAGVLLSMANIQETERDFVGSEVNAIEGIKILKDYPKNESVYYALWSLHNLIGIVSEQVDRYDEAIEYHNKAQEYSALMEDSYILNIYSKYNIAILYRQQGAYDKAVAQFSKILEDPVLEENDPAMYASFLYNVAYSNMLKGSQDTRDMESKFRHALRILKAEEDLLEVMSASEYFSEYFLKQNQKDSALHYADEAYSIARQLNENQSKLNVLLLKSKIEEGEASKAHLLHHIKLNDSLILKERGIRNRFARIEYETEEIKQQKDAISRQREWLIFISAGLLMAIFLLYIIKTQRQRNKELEFSQQQQQANEEIYNLMLSQQNKMDEARAMEKKRISQELHDGILGRLFGARLNLDNLNLNRTDEAINSRKNYISELKDIEQEIRKVSHDLNTDFISNSSFLDIIKTMVEKQTQAYDLEYEIEASQDINWDTLSNKSKIHFYRIIQESLLNIYKHAKASVVHLEFNQKNNLISLAIRDNGEGFDLYKAKKGIGIKNMKSRVAEINGNLEIDTAVEQGTTIKIEIPN